SAPTASSWPTGPTASPTAARSRARSPGPAARSNNRLAPSRRRQSQTCGFIYVGWRDPRRCQPVTRRAHPAGAEQGWTEERDLNACTPEPPRSERVAGRPGGRPDRLRLGGVRGIDRPEAHLDRLGEASSPRLGAGDAEGQRDDEER